jgi:hypothetical protein
MIGVLLDFWEMDRKSFALTLDTSVVSAATLPAQPRQSSGPSEQTQLPGLDGKKLG